MKLAGPAACLGEGMIELARRPDGALRQGFGGDTMNTAIYLARLGVSVDFVTALGRDPESASMIAALERESVGTRLIARVADRLPGLYIIDVDASGERRFLYWRDRAPARELFTLPESPALLAALDGFGLLYLSGISLAIWGERGRAVLFAALDRLRPEGVRIAFDSNWRVRLWPDRKTARDAYTAMLARTDIALAGADDLADLFGDADGDAMLGRMRAAGVGEICLRLAGAACLVAHDDVETHVAAAAVAAIVDTTAAGDSFSAGYLATRLAGKNPHDAARAAHRLAAIVIGHPGAIVPHAATAALAKEIIGAKDMGQ
ncbi:sugar kinase [Lichenicoccus sp.]|uniref:sugar kinase n=1 Tax=Lichenicoccus sp. TaxID=2781899 RepID=UPI003D0D0CAB